MTLGLDDAEDRAETGGSRHAMPLVGGGGLGWVGVCFVCRSRELFGRVDGQEEPAEGR